MAEFKRKRGYITLAQRSGKTDYLRLAYGLALSLRATQSEVSHLSVLVTPGQKVPDKYRAVFDEVIEIPWGDDAELFKWKIHNKWKVYHLTPYEETVLLDCDMIFPTDVSDWWDTMAEREAMFTSVPVTFRGTPIQPKFYRQLFIDNSLPMVYTAFAYFRRSDRVQELFDFTRDVYQLWIGLHNRYRLRQTTDEDLANMAYARSWMRSGWTHFFKDFPLEVSGDLAFASAIKIAGFDDMVSERPFPTFTHMKTADQNLSLNDRKWTEVLPYTFGEDMSLMVGNYRQRYPFHYVEKDWLTYQNLVKLEKANG